MFVCKPCVLMEDLGHVIDLEVRSLRSPQILESLDAVKTYFSPILRAARLPRHLSARGSRFAAALAQFGRRCTPPESTFKTSPNFRLFSPNPLLTYHGLRDHLLAQHRSAYITA
jgi:hypothetical protein